MKRSKFLSIIAVVAAMVTSLSMPLTAEATSRTTTSEVLGVGRSVEDATVNTEDSSVAESALPEVLGTSRRYSLNNVMLTDITDPKALEQLNNLDYFADIISDFTNSSVNADDLIIIDSMDIHVQDGILVSEKNPLFVSFGFPSILETSEVYVFHYGKNGWELIPTTVNEGIVTGEFISFSPGAILAKKSTLKGAVLGADRKKSPRTGEDNLVTMLICAAVLACGSVIVFKKKLFS